MRTKKQPKYLCVNFRDNDFGMPVIAALKRLYEIVAENSYGGSVLSAIMRLHEHKCLVPILNALIDAEYLAGKAEVCTRGIGRPDWDKPIVELPKIPYKTASDYLGIKVSFHTNDAFNNKWSNGEKAYLDLLSGGVSTF